MDNYYEILGVSATARDEAIKAAFKSLAKQYHPDKNPGDRLSEERFKKINEAYQILSDNSKRFFYDMKLENLATGRRAEAPPPSPVPPKAKQKKRQNDPGVKETKVWAITGAGLLVIAIAALVLYNFMNRYTSRQLYAEGLELQENRVWAGALGKYSEAIGYDRQYDGAYYQRGMLRSAVLGDYEGGIYDLTLAIKYTDSSAFLYLNSRADLYTKLNQHDSALADYHKCVVLRPRSDSAWFRIAQMNNHIQKNYTKAIAAYNQVLVINPKFGEAYFGRGLCFQQLGQHDMATREFTAAIKNNGSMPAWFHHRALSELILNRKARACRDFGIALEMGFNKSLKPLQQHCF